MILSPLYVAFVVLLTAALLAVRASSQKPAPKGTKYPPGPKAAFFVGNLFQIPPFHSWFQFKAWADQFGPIYRLNIVGRNNVIVSTEKIANDLLRARGSLYSSREQLPMAAQLMSDNLRPILLPYNDLWRKSRKLMHHLCVVNGAISQPTQMIESAKLLHDLILAPAKYETWLERYAASVVLRLSYGKTFETGEEDFFQRIRKIAHNVERVASPGAYLVDSFPSMLYLPKWLAPFKQEAARMHEEELGLYRTLILEVKDQLDKGIAPTCFAKTWLENQDQYDLSFDCAAYTLGNLFEAGSGTTAAAMMAYFLALIHNPEWQDKVQEEVDRVVGDKRLPNFDDVPNLPTCRAAIKETLRWRPIVAGGLPHQLVKDDVYEGFFFPKDTVVHPNQWAIHREAELYPDPENYRPERWLEKSWPTYKEPLTVHPNLQNFSAFGFGRRICPGLDIAERSLNLLVARLAWACRISKKKDENGVEMDVPLYDYVKGFTVQPKWFPFELKVRSEGRWRLVQKAYEEAKKTDPLKGITIS